MKTRSVYRGLTLIASLALLAGALAWANEAGVGVTADEAQKRLVDGNKRYVANKLVGEKRADAATRASLAKSQKPFAIILSCSDSRVPPEIVFDQGLGDLFIVRVAGNVTDPTVLGSIEYAAEHIGSPLILVLGHERCGAVTAAVEANGVAPGNIGVIVRAIAPAVKQAQKEAAGKPKPEVVETAIDDNIQLVARNLTGQSPVIAKLVKEGKLRIVTGKYDLDTGEVKVMEPAKSGPPDPQPTPVQHGAAKPPAPKSALPAPAPAGKH